jgi:hypothetical protein
MILTIGVTVKSLSLSGSWTDLANNRVSVFVISVSKTLGGTAQGYPRLG